MNKLKVRGSISDISCLVLKGKLSDILDQLKQIRLEYNINIDE